MERGSRLDALGSLRAANVDVAFATAFVTLFTGPFLVGYVQRLGGGDAAIGLLSAIPSLAGILQIPGAIRGRSFPSYKSYVAPPGIAWRLLQLPILALPFLPLPNETKLAILVGIVGLAAATIALVNPIYNEWLAELVPPTSRGFYFSRRNALAAVVGSTVGIGGAWLLDASRDAKGEPTDPGFASVFGLGLICAAVSQFFFLRMKDLPRENPVKRTLKEGIADTVRPFADPTFRRVLGFIAVSVISQLFAGNLYAAFGRESLGLNFRVLQGTAVTMAIGNVLAAPVWGFLSDRYGNRPTLMIALVLLATNPIAWLVCVPGADVRNSAILLGSHVVMGVAWAGVNLCQFNLLLATAKTEDRANYLASGLALTAVMGGVAPLLGAATMSALRGPMGAEGAYKAVFWGVILWRIGAAFALTRVRDESSTGFRETFRELRSVTPAGFRTVRRLGRTASAEERVDLLHAAAEGGTELASDRILAALSDPLPSVRREAARAVAGLKDPRAVEELLRRLDEEPEMAEEPLVDALGTLADPRAIPALVRLMRSPRPLLRRAAARALGRIDGLLVHAEGHGAEALFEAAGDPHDPDLRRAALQALRTVGGREATEPIRAALHDRHPSVRVAAAEAVAELGLTEAADDLREALRTPDNAGAELAYALGAVGGREDLPTVLAEASRAESAIARRRALLGAARILGVERESYRLMLLTGMPLDSALAAMAGRGRSELKAAVRLALAGNEPDALRVLARLVPSLEPFAATPVEDALLVALPAATKV